MAAVIGAVLGWLAGSRWVLVAAKWGAVGLTILLFLLSVRRAGERAGQMAQRLDTMEKANHVQRRMLEAALAGLALAASWLGACATGSSEPPIVAVCPPVVEYSAEFRARAAGELELLPEGSAVVEMLGDYAVTRDQARECRWWLRSGHPITGGPMGRRASPPSSLPASIHRATKPAAPACRG